MITEVLDGLASTPMVGLYVGGMVFGMVLLGVLFARWKVVPRKYFIIHFLVMLWSGLVYTTMVVDIGLPYAPIYVDWIITTPLMILALGLSAHIGIRKNYPLIFGAVLIQVMIIGTGVVAHMLNQMEIFFVGMVFLLILLYVVWWPLRRVAKTGLKTYDTLAFFITIMWIIYPLIWISGSMGLGLISQETTANLFIAVPFLSKFGFAFLDLGLIRNSVIKF